MNIATTDRRAPLRESREEALARFFHPDAARQDLMAQLDERIAELDKEQTEEHA